MGHTHACINGTHACMYKWDTRTHACIIGMHESLTCCSSRTQAQPSTRPRLWCGHITMNWWQGPTGLHTFPPGHYWKTCVKAAPLPALLHWAPPPCSTCTQRHPLIRFGLCVERRKGLALEARRRLRLWSLSYHSGTSALHPCLITLVLLHYIPVTARSPLMPSSSSTEDQTRMALKIRQEWH